MSAPNVFGLADEEELSSQPPVNVFEAVEQRDGFLRSALGESLTSDVERDAQVESLSRKVGLESSFVGRHFDELQRTWTESQFDPAEFEKSNPHFARMLEERRLPPSALKDEKIGALRQAFRTGNAISTVQDAATGDLPQSQEDWQELSWWERAFVGISAGHAFRQGAEVAPGAAAVNDAEETLARSAGELPPRQAEYVDDARAREGQDLSGLARVKAPWMTFQDQMRQNEANDLASSWAWSRLKGHDAFAQELALAELEPQLKPRDYEAGPLEQIFHDFAEIAPSRIQSLKGMGVGGAAAYGVAALTGAAATRSKQGAHIAGRLAAPVGAKVGMGIAGFNQEMGAAIRDYKGAKTDNGEPLSDTTVIGGAIAYASLASWIETWSFGAEAKAAGPLGEAFASGQGKAYLKQLFATTAGRQMAGNFAKAWVQQAGTETLEEITQEIAQDVIGYLGRMGQAGEVQTADAAGTVDSIMELAPKVFGGSLVGAVGGSVAMSPANAVAGHMAHRQASERSAQRIEAIAEVMKSPLAQSHPETLAELIAAETAESGEEVTAIWVDSEQAIRLFQENGIDPREVLGEDGVQALEEAAATGSKLEVPMAVYLEGWASSSVADLLVPHLAVRPSAETRAESEKNAEATLARAEEIAAEMEAASEGGKEKEKKKALPPRIAMAVEADLIAGGYTPQRARQVASVVQARLETAAKRAGTTADELFAGDSIRFNVEGREAGQQGLFGSVLEKVKARFGPKQKKDEAPTEAATEGAESVVAEADALMTAAQDAVPAASRTLSDAFLAAPREGRMESYYRDGTTGLLNRRGFDRLPPDAARPLVAQVSVEGVKHINDTAGHGQADGLYRTVGRLLSTLVPDAAKVGGDFAIRVADEVELQAVIDTLNAEPELAGLTITGVAGETIQAAGEAHGARKAEMEAAGERAQRGERPLGLQMDPQALTFSEDLADSMALAPEMEGAFDALSEEQAFSDVYIEAETGLLTGEGFKALPPKKFRASIDLNGLKWINDTLSKEAGNALLILFGRHSAENGASGFDFAHLSGDEYAAQADDHAQLKAFLDYLTDVAEDADLSATFKGEQITYSGITFGYGIGATDAEADAALNRHKAELEAAGKRGPEAYAQRLQRGVREDGEGGRVPANFDPGRAARLEAGRRLFGGTGRQRFIGRVKGVAGKETRVITPQRPKGEPARYQVIESRDLIASHHEGSFQPNEAYPAGVQEREYHRQPEEQAKVASGAQQLNPDLLLTDSPTAIDGPPIVTSGNRAIVLGGNGRSMMVRRAFHGLSNREIYKRALLAKAEAFGVDPAAIEGMNAPVLVRVLDGVDSGAAKADLVAAVRRTNESLTQALSPRARSVAEAKSLSPETIGSIAALLDEGDGELSLREVMAKRPQQLVEILRRDGVITNQNASAWVAGTTLTDEAKDRIEGMFLGRVVGSGDRMAQTAPAILAKMERLAPHLVKVEGMNPAMDETPTVQAALDLLNDAQRRGLSIQQATAQTGLFGGDQHDPAVVRLAQLILQSKPKELEARFKAWAHLASFDPRQATMFSANPTQQEARATLLAETVVLNQDGQAVVLYQGAARSVPQTETAEFSRWFGDSKVVDAEGRPLVVYHGTNQPLVEFDPGRLGANTKTVSARDGFFFTSIAEDAGGYAEMAAQRVVADVAAHERKTADLQRKLQQAEARRNWAEAERLTLEWEEHELGAMRAEGSGQNIVPVYLSIHNPMVVDANGMMSTGEVSKGITDAKAAGYDGLILRAIQDSPVVGLVADHYVAFRPEQIKSATGNRGTFDPNSPNILEQSAATAAHDARGYMEKRGNEYRITLGKNHDISTIFHELGHVFFFQMKDLAARPDAPQQIKDDFQTTLDWLGVARWEDVGREQHEQFARGFEAYLMEGQAPSAGLARVFEWAALWMGKVYRSIRSLDVALNDDVRDVFDRMLATDDEIQRARNAMGYDEQLFRSHVEMGVTPEEFEAYRAEKIKALSFAAQQARLKLMKERLAEKEAFWREQEIALREEAKAEYEQLPARRAWLMMRGQMVDADGKTTKLENAPRIDYAETVKAVGAEKARRFLTAKKGGISIDDMAQIVGGFESGAEMLQAADALPERNAWAKERAKEMMRERHGSLLADQQALREEIGKGLHGDFTAQWLLRELQAFRKKAGLGPITEGELKLAAQLMVDRKQIVGLNPGRSLQAERAAARKALEAALKGNFRQAALHSQERLISMWMYRYTKATKEEMAKGERRMTKSASDAHRGALGKYAPAFRDAHDGILAAIGLGPQRPDAGDALDALAEAEAVALGENVAFGEWFETVRSIVANPTKWKHLTPPQGRALLDGLKQMRTMADAANTYKMGWGDVAFDVLVEGIVEDAKALPDLGKAPAARQQVSTARKTRDFALGLMGNLIDPEELFKTLGPTMYGFWDRYLKAKTEKYRLARELLQPLMDAWTKTLPKEVLAKRFEVISALDRQLPIDESINLAGPRDRMWLLMVLLNMGNESNKDRLLGGFGWTEAQVMDALNEHLSEAEFGWAQSIWDLNDQQLWPLVAAKEERKTGLRPTKIRATPLVTKHGTLAGGYFPARYDPHAAASVAGERQAEESISTMYGPGYRRASTAKSHTKERVQNFTDVLFLDWGTLPAHFAQVTHDLAFDEFVRDFARILFHGDVKDTLYQRLGEKRSKDLREWLQYAANSQTVQENEVGKLLGIFKTRMVTGAIGWSATVAISDFANAFLAMAKGYEQGGTSVRYGLPAYFAGPVMRGAALKKSSELRNRNEWFRQERRQQFLARLGKKQGKLTSAVEAVGNTAWFFLQQTDKLASSQIWWARYWESKDRGLPESEAISMADSAVRTSLPSPERAELPKLLREPGSVGGLLVFFGYFSKVLNVTASLGRASIHAGTKAIRSGKAEDYAKAMLTTAEMAGRALAVMFVSNVMGEVLSGRGMEEDEEPEEYLLRKMASAPLTLLPIVGPDLATHLEAAIRDKPVIHSSRAPSVSLVFDMLRNVGKVFDEDLEDGDRVWAAVETALFSAKLPVRQPRRTLGYLEAILNGEAQSTGPFGMASGFLYGERENQPQNLFSMTGDVVGAK